MLDASSGIMSITLGEVFISTENGGERRLGPGDMAFFPAGASCEWRIADRVRKVAVMRKTLGYPLGFGVRDWYKLLNIAGLRDRDRPPNNVERRRFEAGAFPELAGRIEGIDAGVLPPASFITHAMDQSMMDATKRGGDSETGSCMERGNLSS